MITTRSRAILLALAGASCLAAQSTPIPGKFYEYYVVANTKAGQFTLLGEPALNDNGLCAFMGQTSIGQTIWTGDGNNHALFDINPGSGNPGSVTFSTQMQINDNNQVAARDEILGTSSNIRLWNANTANSYTYIARAGSGQKYNALYPAPGVNKGGSTVFGAISGSGQTQLVEDTAGKFPSFGINTGTPQPLIATNGNMVITTTNLSNGLNQITLFTNAFASQVDIADGTNFSYLDTAPGISADGNVVVFEGTVTTTGAATLGTTPGPGIFASVNTGSAWQVVRVTGLMVEAPNSGGNNNGACEPGETCINAAELGYDDNNNALYFNSYPINNRVAVSNLTLGASGIADDSFVISFMGTPSGASKTNPILGNFPLLFSNQTGLWTIRVDVEQQLESPFAMVFHPYTALAVAQVGDQIGQGNIVSSIDVNVQIANAAEDETGTIRTMRRGDHRIAFLVNTTSGGQIIYRANHLDSDQDGLLDAWETTGIDMNQDGVVDLNLAAMGANPNSRDLFVQMDWLTSQPSYNFHPAPGVNTSATGGAGALPGMLATAHALSGTMYGMRSDGGAPATIPAGIAMHIDAGSGSDADNKPFSYNMGAGPLAGGNQIGLNGPNDPTLVEILYFGVPDSISLTGVSTLSFQTVKDQYFGTKDADARELAFKYAVLADHYSFVDSPPAAHPITGAAAGYILVGDAYPAGLTSGNFIKITQGTGAAQTVEISGFSKTVPNQMFVTPNFTTIPDTSSKFAYLSGSSGVSEVYFYPTPDDNSFPGNDFMLTLGNWGTNPQGYLMNACTQWRTLAHEMGHTLGLRHGGVDQQTDNDNYHSLMSYSYQLTCNLVTSVQGYSTTGDAVFDDFANLNHQFPSVSFHVGNSLTLGFGSGGETTQQAPEQNLADYVTQNGPVDLTKPVVTINSPAASASVALGSPLPISMTATDNVAVAKVQVTFDANGDGTIEPGEILTAKAGANNAYTSEYATISGSPGTRVLTAIATDTSGNIAQATVSLKVINPNPAPVLKTLSPSSATHGGATFNLTINGTGFLSGCIGQWKGASRKTTFVSSTQIKMAVLSTDIASAGTAQVTVANPAEGTNKSNALTFTIN